MIVSNIILIVSLFLDGILSNFFPYMTGNLSVFTPMLTITSIIIIYPFYKKKLRNYYISCLLVGFFYDFLYTNMVFYNAILFLGLGFIIMLLYRYIRIHWLSLILFVIAVIFCYEGMNAIIILSFQLVPMTFYRFLYKVLHSLLLNIIYAELLYFIIWLLPKKYKEISINM